MAKRELVLRTKRLELKPMSDEEITASMEQSSADDYKRLCSQAIELCAEYPEQRVWCAPWKISRRSDGKSVGEIGFMGPAVNSTVEIYFGIHEEMRGNGYTSEALKVATEWAFSNPDVLFIEAEATDANHASKKVLEKLEFKPDGVGIEGTRYYKEKVEAWLSVYMCFGMAIGCAMGTTIGNLGVGIGLGLCLGVSVGASIDSAMRRKRSKIREAKRSLES